MLGVGLWGGAKGNSHMGKGHREGASMYFGHLSSSYYSMKQGTNQKFLVGTSYEYPHYVFL